MDKKKVQILSRYLDVVVEHFLHLHEHFLVVAADAFVQDDLVVVHFTATDAAVVGHR